MENYIRLINDYAWGHTSAEPDVLQKLSRETWAKVYAPQMMASPLQGSLLRLISQMIRPRLVLEIGTFTGYSAICLASGLRPNGQLHTIEINPELEENAKRYFKDSGLDDRIVLHIGNALNLIPTFNVFFDLVYIDAGKEKYIDLYELCLPKVRKGGFILADNALWYGKVVSEVVAGDKDTKAIRLFNDHVQQDSRTENMLLPFEDGIMIIRKL